MEKEALIALLEKYTTDRCSEADATQLIRHIRSGQDRETVESFITERVFADPANDVRHLPGTRESLVRVFERVQRAKHDAHSRDLDHGHVHNDVGSHNESETAKIIRTPVRRRLATIAVTAAAILIFLSVGLYWYTTTQQRADTGQIALEQGRDVLPGGNRAILTLDAGRQIALSDAHRGIIIDESLRYEDGTAVGAPDLQSVESLRTTTPNGGQYQLTLPDGTEVWLNAASSLRYPTRFTGGTRVVELAGEAYFAVAKNSQQPFIVKSSGQEIEVLGTEFNISAYADETEARTTLIEGAVKVSHHLTGVVRVLAPGEQAIRTDDQLRITTADLNTVTAWKNGRF